MSEYLTWDEWAKTVIPKAMESGSPSPEEWQEIINMNPGMVDFIKNNYKLVKGKVVRIDE